MYNGFRWLAILFRVALQHDSLLVDESSEYGYSPFNMVKTTTKKKTNKNIHSKLLHTMTVI